MFVISSYLNNWSSLDVTYGSGWHLPKWIYRLIFIRGYHRDVWCKYNSMWVTWLQTNIRKGRLPTTNFIALQLQLYCYKECGTLTFVFCLFYYVSKLYRYNLDAIKFFDYLYFMVWEPYVKGLIHIYTTPLIEIVDAFSLLTNVHSFLSCCPILT